MSSEEDLSEPKRSQLESINEEENEDLVDGSDTSSFTAFLYSLLSSSDSGDNSNSDEKKDNTPEMVGQSSEIVRKESVTRKGLLSRGKQSLRAIYQAGITGGYQSQGCKGESDLKLGDESNDNFDGLEIKHTQILKEPVELGDLPSVSEPSLLLSERARSALYASRPALAQGRNW
ncbi:uncharacterized protein LOC110643568 isoform X2 [Hevea brasiliensis]|uniref:uncharacterized protein LOC110643568 isoform X2 n=1 Tax=Hevea brasiliensis TaxID=3981 RepID=UPI0025FD9EAE|nr:uncharacterized protein LOC110643568 isoform X2 [Hevea brasiliensis]